MALRSVGQLNFSNNMRKKPFVGQFGAKNDYEDDPKNECCTPDGKKMKTKI